MRSAWIAAAGLTAMLSIGVAPSAEAQTFLTPYAGATFGADAPATQPTVGVALTFMGNVAGVELDLGYTPDFFNEDDDDVVLIGDSNVTSLMGSLIIGVGEGPVRPYGAIGLGLLRSRVDGGDLFDDVTTNDFGFNAGFGVMGMVSDHVGFRGDIRYFRSLEDPEDDDDFDVEVGNFDFWRATAGVTFRF
jgi:opacity protein-like surface antigen